MPHNDGNESAIRKKNRRIMVDEATGKKWSSCHDSKAGMAEPACELLTGIKLVADISATSPHHFLVLCHIFASFGRKIKVDSVLESGESCASI